MKISTLIRLVLTAILLYLAYGETGIATTTILTLMAIRNELTVLVARNNEPITRPKLQGRNR